MPQYELRKGDERVIFEPLPAEFRGEDYRYVRVSLKYEFKSQPEHILALLVARRFWVSLKHAGYQLGAP